MFYYLRTITLHVNIKIIKSNTDSFNISGSQIFLYHHGLMALLITTLENVLNLLLGS